MKVRPDIVHSYTPKAGLVAMVASFMACIPVRIHTFTGLLFPTSNGLKRLILLLIDRLICAVSTNVVPEGEGVLHDLKNNRVTSKPLKVIGNGNIAGVDTNHFHPAVDPGHFSSSVAPFTFCFVGRVNRDKGVQELVSAFTSLEADARLLLVGEVDHTAPVDADTLLQILSHPRIEATGFLDDIRPPLAACDVLVLPSYREGFPNVVLQAGAMGKPVIASDINGCNEVIQSEFNGWLVPPADTRALAEIMQHVMFLPEQYRFTLGRNARDRVVQRYEQEAYRERLLEFYSEVVNEAPL